MRQFIVFGSGVNFAFGKIEQEVFIAIEASKAPEIKGEHILCIPLSDYERLQKDYDLLFQRIKNDMQQG